MTRSDLYVEKCGECGSKDLVYDHDRAEVVCTNCGLVVSEKVVDHGPEWRAFDQEQKDRKERVGAPISYVMHDKGLSTLIDWRNKDIHGRHLGPGMRARIYRLRKWQTRIKVIDSSERNLAYALSELARISSRLGIPKNVQEATAVIYRKALQEKIVRGRSIEGMTSASLYTACRRCNLPRTLDEIEEASSVDKREIGRNYRLLVKFLSLKIPQTNPGDYIPRFSSKLGLDGRVQSVAISIINTALEAGLASGRSPTGMAAAAIYIASVLCGERRTQREVAEACKVTEVTVRNRYKELVEALLPEIVRLGAYWDLSPEEIASNLNIDPAVVTEIYSSVHDQQEAQGRPMVTSG